MTDTHQDTFRRNQTRYLSNIAQTNYNSDASSAIGGQIINYNILYKRNAYKKDLIAQMRGRKNSHSPKLRDLYWRNPI